MTVAFVVLYFMVIVELLRYLGILLLFAVNSSDHIENQQDMLELLTVASCLESQLN